MSWTLKFKLPCDESAEIIRIWSLYLLILKKYLFELVCLVLAVQLAYFIPAYLGYMFMIKYVYLTVWFFSYVTL